MSDENEMTIDELLAKEAETHDSYLQFLIGYHYYCFDSDGKRDCMKAFHWFKLAAIRVHRN